MITTAHAKLAMATKRFNALTDTLERMADWRDELEGRLWLASQFSLDATERARLAADVHTFSAECFALASSITAKHRRAA